ncbi:MAG TPA: pilin [Candidatus Saccharimonadales bacterium]|nr:pilin [Candidatus Saccharimonadales bacterium]
MATNCAKPSFFFLPTWYEYLNFTADPSGGCSVAINFPQDTLPIGLAILDILLRLAGFVAVIAIIISGIMYITATGSPEKAAAARKRLYNSLIGLAIAFVAAGVVAFIGNSVK